MSVLGLSRLFAPRSVAVIGASNRALSFGNAVMRNLLGSGFCGPILPVNPSRQAVAGVLAYPSVADLPVVPDLAVLCVRGERVPEQIELLGRRGTAGAIVPALDVDRDAMLAAARRHGVRVLGPGSLGIQVPRAHLDASLAHLSTGPGRVAFVSQSGALCTAVLDWARPRGIGFSCFVSLGGCADVDFADMLDHLANDPDTKAILLYIESIAERRALMPAMRAAARNKPVSLIKAGRDESNRPIGAFLAESLAAPDDVFDAAVRRAGALRVMTVDDLFGSVETLARAKPVRGDRLAVIANGGGTMVIARDELDSGPGQAAELSPETVARLGATLPAGAVRGGMVDLGIAAPPARYAEALGALAAAPEIDAILVIHAPTPLAESRAVAQAVIDTQRAKGGTVLTCWIGEETAAGGRRLLAEGGLPSFPTVGAAIGGFRHLLAYRRNQEMLMETPPADGGDLEPDHAQAAAIIAQGLAAPDGLLDDGAARALLAAYGIDAVPAHSASDGAKAARIAERIGFPVALTVCSPDITRKWDVGGVALNLESGEAVEAAAAGILRRVARHRPDARLGGFSVQRMALRPNARQLMLGIACDPLFGPVLVFGEGGRAVEVVRDHTVALPPLNLPLARQALERTRVARRLDAHGFRPGVDRDALALALVRLSRLLVDHPEIVACDINPLFADEQGVLAVDARVRVSPPEAGDRRRFSVLPYPTGLEERATLHDGTPITLRPIRPEDEPAHAELVRRMTPQDLRYRFFGATRELQHDQLARLTQIDYEREMAFVATRTTADGQPETVGVVRTVTDPDGQRAELAILVRSDLKGTGLGTRLIGTIVAYHRRRGTHEITAQVLAENQAMIRLARRCGFEAGRSEEEPDLVECRLILGPQPDAA